MCSARHSSYTVTESNRLEAYILYSFVTHPHAHRSTLYSSQGHFDIGKKTASRMSAVRVTMTQSADKTNARYGNVENRKFSPVPMCLTPSLTEIPLEFYNGAIALIKLESCLYQKAERV